MIPSAERKKKASNAIIHLCWVIALLSFAIVGLLVYSPNGDILQSYVSFAAAIASILLALIAIIFSFIANQTFSETVGELKGTVDESGQVSRKIMQASESLQIAIEEIKKEFSGIVPTVEEISKKIDLSLSPAAPQFDSNGTNEKLTNLFPGGTTPGIDASIYAFLLADKNGQKEISYEEIFENSNSRESLGSIWANYCNAVASTLQATNACGMKFIRKIRPKEGSDDVSVTSYQVTDWGDVNKDELMEYVMVKNDIPESFKAEIDSYFSKA